MPPTPQITDQVTEARWSEARVFSVMLSVIFVASVAVFLALPSLLPAGTSGWIRSALNGGLLTTVCAPVLWRLVVDPLRALAVAEQAKADAIVRTAADGILTFDERGVVSSFNAAAEGIFGCGRDEAVGQRLGDLIPDWPESPEADHQAGSVEMRGRRCDGASAPLLDVAISHIDLPKGRLSTAIIRDITERKRIEEELQRAYRAQEQAQRDLEARVTYRTVELAQANQQLQSQSELMGNVLSSIPHAVYWKNRASLFLGCNEIFARAVGLERAERILGLTDGDLTWSEEEAAASRQRDEAVMDSGAALLDVEEARQKPDGTWATALTSRVPMRDRAGQVIGLIGIWGDITERKQVEAALQASEQRLRSLVRNVADVFAVLDLNGAIQYISPAAGPVLGYTPEELAGRVVFDLVIPEDRGRAQQIFVDACDGRDGAGEVQMFHADQSRRTFEIIGANLLGDPAVRGILMTCHDVTERKAFEGRLVHQAFHDALTGLPNRALFMDRLERAMARARRQNTSVAVIFIDLDNFKVINDSLGHEAGDQLLMSVAQRLPDCVRAIDTVARLGGDEFTVLLEDLADAGEVAEITERITGYLLAPVWIQEREVFTSVSVGVALSRGEYATPDDLLRDADTAMYRAKTSGKGCAVTFDHSMNTHAMERLELETDLRRALENGEFRLHYQPIMSMETGAVSGVEALVRWEHPRHGLVPPARFIPLAEETGLILALGRWVLEEACRQAVRWQAQAEETGDWVISVNLSARQLQQEDLVAEVAGVLSDTGLDPRRLKLEITETVMMLDSETALDKLHALKDLGVKLAIDDFGTGYSSMAYLSTLPIDTLKIDRSFINKIGSHAEGEAIVRTIVSLAKMLNLHVTSEGIETPEQRDYLRQLDCDWGQGYLYAHPLTATEVARVLLAPPGGVSALPPPVRLTRRAA